MPCYYLLHGWMSKHGKRSKVDGKFGKRYWTADREKADMSEPMDVPCGQCIGCRLMRSAAWAARCMH